MKRELAIEFKEMNRFAVQCRCGTVVTFGMGVQVKITPEMCCGCGKSFGDLCVQAIRSFKEAHRMASLMEDNVDAPSLSIQIPFTG